MRIIGGKHKGAQIKSRKTLATRPLLARVKKSLFSIISPELPGSHFLDLFAGTGAVGIEALSRGASFCVFVDQNYQCAELIRENLQRLNLVDKTQVLAKKVSSAINILQEQGQKFDLIFIGAPYATDFAARTVEQLASSSLLRENSIVIAEVRISTPLPTDTGSLHLARQETYGDTVLFFYSIKCKE